MWENVGAFIAGIDTKKNKIFVRMPAGEIVAVDASDVRVFEPRPVSR